MKTSLSLSQLSIKEFVGLETGAHSGNFGVVELMLLHACDRCIFSKAKWILAMDMCIAKNKELHEKARGIRQFKVVLETEDGQEIMVSGDSRDYDSSLRDIEKSLLLSVSVFSQQLWKYNVMQGCSILRLLQERR
ncbi:MAG: hypothetical protein SGCHY_002158 [Lobulomycetales sp.]